MRNNHGAILISLLITIVFLTAIGVSLITLVYSRNIEISMEIDKIKAFYLAEAGIAAAINELKTGLDVDNDGLGNIKPKRLGDGIYEVRHYYQDSIIVAIGTSNDIQRTLQIKYSAS